MTAVLATAQSTDVQTEEVSERRGFRADVQGLRAVAVLTVFAFHYRFWPFRGGYVGVDVFFVISGFVITSMMLRERAATGGLSIPSFMARRVRRVLPAATVVLVATVSATYLLVGVAVGREVGRDGIASALFVANRHFADINTRYLAAFTLPSPLLHFWSLSIEEQFYLVWPATFVAIVFVVQLVRQRWILPAAVAVLGGLSMWHAAAMTASNPTAAYYDTTTRVGELLVGCLVAMLPSLSKYARPIARAALGWLGLFVIVGSAIFYSAATPFPGTAVLVPVFGAAAVILSGGECLAHGPEWLLAKRPLTWVGDRSYSIYLWHWPVFVLAWERVGHIPGLSGRVLLVVVSMFFSILSYRYVEQPLRKSARLKHHRSRTLVFGACLIGIGVVTPLIWAGASSPAPTWHGVILPVVNQRALDAELRAAAKPGPLPPLVVSSANILSDSPVPSPCLVTLDDPRASDVPVSGKLCTAGDLKSHRTLVLYGDSHAIQWLPALDVIGQKRHFTIVVITRGACPVADVLVWDDPMNRSYDACLKSHPWAVAKINQLHPFAVIMADFHSATNLDGADHVMSPATFLSGFTHTISTLKAPGRRLIEIGPTPLPSTFPLSCFGIHFLEVQACSADAKAAVTASTLPGEQSTLERAGVAYISTVPWFCTATTCPIVVNHIATFADSGHVSKHYAVHLWRVLDTALAKAGVN